MDQDDINSLKREFRMLQATAEHEHEKFKQLQAELAQAHAEGAVMREALRETLNYLNHRTDDLCGDDLVGDGRLTYYFKRQISQIDRTLSQTTLRLPILELVEALEKISIFYMSKDGMIFGRAKELAREALAKWRAATVGEK